MKKQKKKKRRKKKEKLKILIKKGDENKENEWADNHETMDIEVNKELNRKKI